MGERKEMITKGTTDRLCRLYDAAVKSKPNGALGPTKEDREFEDALYSLSYEERWELIALIWVGRGEYHTLKGGVQDASGLGGKDALVGYIAGQPLRRWVEVGWARMPELLGPEEYI